MFPTDRKGRLDKDLLKKMGLTKERMQNGDALFFYQLLFPICNPKRSGIEGDPRQPYYLPRSQFTNSYAIDVKQRNGIYNNIFPHTHPEEQVNWDGIVARNVNDYIGDCYVKENQNTYDSVIADTMYFRRWLDIKSCLKLCDFRSETKRGDANYDPTQKYRLPWDVLVYNLNQFVEVADKDLTGDESSWPSEAYSDMHGLVPNKPGMSKGGALIVKCQILLSL